MASINHNFENIITKEELARNNGANNTHPYIGLYIPSKKVIAVFDAVSRADLYGPDGSYHIFSGRDASRALATMDLAEKNSHVDDLTEEQISVLEDWAKKYLDKYPVVGVLEQ